MKRDPNARISRVHGSWRVRVFGHSPKFFADSAHGGTEGALQAARAWRDERWDGSTPGVKLSAEQKEEIRNSTDDYREVAARYGISAGYVHQIRRGSK